MEIVPLTGPLFENMANSDTESGGFGDSKRLGVKDDKQRGERITEQGSNRFIRATTNFLHILTLLPIKDEN